MFNSIVLKFKNIISALFGRGKNKHKTVGMADKNKEPLRYEFELAVLCSFVGNLSLTKNIDGKYLDPKIESSWWSWCEVYATTYNGDADKLTPAQHKELFQKALLSSPYASHHSSSDLLSVNDSNHYSIDWVESAWGAWMQAVYMYKIQ